MSAYEDLLPEGPSAGSIEGFREGLIRRMAMTREEADRYVELFREKFERLTGKVRRKRTRRREYHRAASLAWYHRQVSTEAGRLALRARQREYFRHRMKDPEFRERVNAQNRARYRRRQLDPEKRAEHNARRRAYRDANIEEARAAQRRYYAKRVATPEGRERVNADKARERADRKARMTPEELEAFYERERAYQKERRAARRLTPEGLARDRALRAAAARRYRARKRTKRAAEETVRLEASLEALSAPLTAPPGDRD